ncbi:MULTISPECIES: hypothetical protein [Gammaproteobacteria]|uniref:hypothetical protein n=1 Tax=Gammaproteobacteria TaxID=1236 RepID=UPI001ADB04B6|nr:MULTISPECIES: hypothetical protein [Gammaproteobacteria]MBO9483209.1 hypothetical protein [Salinisphaera sp. G21_0]MBO9496005.1 hypothetical protein [Thalassotalea sp. G20_0]
MCRPTTATTGNQQKIPFLTEFQTDMIDGGRFGHRKTTKRSTTTQVIQDSNPSADLSAKPSLKDRLVYPFKAVRNRILTAMMFGGSAGMFMGMGAGAAVGATAGFTVALIPQILDLLTFSFNPYIVAAGAYVGKEAGIRTGAVLGLGIGAVATLASAAIALALSVVHLPRDIYHAATLDAPRLDAPLPEKPWLTQQLSQELSKFNE